MRSFRSSSGSIPGARWPGARMLRVPDKPTTTLKRSPVDVRPARPTSASFGAGRRPSGHPARLAVVISIVDGPASKGSDACTLLLESERFLEFFIGRLRASSESVQSPTDSSLLMLARVEIDPRITVPVRRASSRRFLEKSRVKGT